MPQARQSAIAQALHREIARQNPDARLDIETMAHAVDQALSQWENGAADQAEGKTPDELNSANDG